MHVGHVGGHPLRGPCQEQKLPLSKKNRLFSYNTKMEDVVTYVAKLLDDE